MEKDLPIYVISIDLDDDATGVEANSGVHDPAHELLTMTFSNHKKVTKFSKTDLIDSSVAVPANSP